MTKSTRTTLPQVYILEDTWIRLKDGICRVDHFRAIKESVLEEDITVNHCPGNEMIADCLTKRGANSQGLLNIITTGSISELFNNNRQ